MIEPAVALHRFGLGPRPGDLDTFAADPRGALAAEISDRAAAFLDGGGLPDSPAAMALLQAHLAETKAGQKAGGNPQDAVKTRPGETLNAEIAARIKRARSAQCGLTERLVGFWVNHFAMELDSKPLTRFFAGVYEREAIRPHVLGRFEDMLLAVTQHAAMLTYLDGATSIGPNSPAGQKREAGLNENHAREIFELHTVGVEGGYTQADVTALARILTGWTIDRKGPNSGRFSFRARLHEPGAHAVLGVEYPADGVAQGKAALRDLAQHQSTALHIARKLARHFVADLPPEPLVERLSATFIETHGDLQAVALALIGSDDAWADTRKLKSPQEFVWSALRALNLRAGPGIVAQSLRELGHPIWNPPSPEGFGDTTPTWLAPDALADRLAVAERFAAAAQVDNPLGLLEPILGPGASAETRVAVERAESPAQGLALLLMSPEFLWR